MSRILSVKNGIEYFKKRRKLSTKQTDWDYYNNEINRLEHKLYELEVTKELDEQEFTSN